MTDRMRAFVDAYAGDATKAARSAGYTGSDATLRVTACNLMKDPRISEAIKGRQETQSKATIATRQERQELWTALLRDPEVDMRDRLKASELLGKSEADFTEKVEHSGALTLEQIVAGAGAKK